MEQALVSCAAGSALIALLLAMVLLVIRNF